MKECSDICYENEKYEEIDLLRKRLLEIEEKEKEEREEEERKKNIKIVIEKNEYAMNYVLVVLGLLDLYSDLEFNSCDFRRVDIESIPTELRKALCKVANLNLLLNKSDYEKFQMKIANAINNMKPAFNDEFNRILIYLDSNENEKLINKKIRTKVSLEDRNNNRKRKVEREGR